MTDLLAKFPRRQRLPKFTPAEKAIWDACIAVEAAGASIALTDAINLLHQARYRIADHVDAQMAKEA